jgi:N-acetylneuraminic acid mutarotase
MSVAQLLLSLCASILTTSAFAQSGTLAWLDRSPLPNSPSARSGHGMAAIGETIYLFGGRSLSGQSLDDFYALDVSSSAKPPVWNSISKTNQAVWPTARNKHGMAVANQKIFVLGGTSFSDIPLADLWEYSGGIWISRADTAGGPSARQQHSMAAVGEKIYVFGGMGTREILADLFELTVPSGSDAPTWRDLTRSMTGSSPASRYAAGLVGLGNRLYLFGGARATTMSDTFHEYDIDSNSWSDLSSTSGKPSARSELGIAALPDKFILFGGRGSSFQEYFDDAYEYSSSTWKLLTRSDPLYTSTAYLQKSPPARSNYGMAGVGSSRVFVFGGSGPVNGFVQAIGDLFELEFSYNLACDAGFYQDGEGCLECPLNSTSLLGSDAVADCKCIEGAEGPAGGPCTDCVEGKFKTWNVLFSTSASDSCASCPVNTYKSKNGSGSCTPCPAGTITIDTGATDLTMCQCGPGSAATATGRCVCAAGYWGEPRVRCTLCNGNSSSAQNSTLRTGCKCNPGYTGPDGGTCTPCASGFYKSDAGSANCTKCPDGWVLVLVWLACVSISIVLWFAYDIIHIFLRPACVTMHIFLWLAPACTHTYAESKVCHYIHLSLSFAYSHIHISCWVFTPLDHI